MEADYLSIDVNSFFLGKSKFMRSSAGIKERLPIKNDVESSLVDKSIQISNLDLIRDMDKIIKLDEFCNKNIFALFSHIIVS